jgi:hypothetical protein
MFKRAGPLAAVLLAALVLAPGATPGTYADKSGDSGSAGDITGIQVAADKASGQMIFRVEGSNLSTSPNDLTILFIDSDANPATGQVSLVGADYVFAIDDTTYEFDHWNGSDWVETPNSTVRVTGGGPALMSRSTGANWGTRATSTSGLAPSTWSTKSPTTHLTTVRTTIRSTRMGLTSNRSI